VSVRMSVGFKEPLHLDVNARTGQKCHVGGGEMKTTTEFTEL
jgi:hypothetical protein